MRVQELWFRSNKRDRPANEKENLLLGQPNHYNIWFKSPKCLVRLKQDTHIPHPQLSHEQQLPKSDR
jgi:hypothetical protein